MNDYFHKPFIISIAGAHSGSGKTTFAEKLIKRLEGNLGVIKYTKTSFYTSITDSLDVINQHNKDTSRLLHAGAKRVLWVQSPFEELKDALDVAVGNLSDLDGIIVEGNSPIEFLDPDIIIFIFGRDTSRIKESAKNVLKKSSIVVYQKKPSEQKKNFASIEESSLSADRQGFPTILKDAKGKKHCYVSLQRKEEGMDKCIDVIMDELKVKKIEKRLMEFSIDDRIPCALARRIAEELNVPYRDVGEAANRLKIKIKDCQLGCF